jgi:hypothetical protein
MGKKRTRKQQLQRALLKAQGLIKGQVHAVDSKRDQRQGG